MPTHDLCLNCFEKKGSYDICPKCGFLEGTLSGQAFHLRPGETLGRRYLVGTVLGYGGFGVTYKAWDSTLSAVVAIKEFFPGDLVSRIPGHQQVVIFSGERAESYKTQLNRFLDEARNMAKFNNDPHIVGVYDFFEENNTAYIVMEYLDGMTLKAYMAQKGGKLPEEEALHYGELLLTAVHSVHAKKIIHRDISPDNIFILKDGRLKALDFGAARFAENPDGLTSTVVIKPGYAPPEQYRSKMKQGIWTDLYAVGATLYKMLTGVTPEESIDRMEKDSLIAPSKLVPLVNTQLDKIILKAMALSPELRFQKASEFLDAIQGRREVDLPEVEMRRRSNRRALSVALSVMAVIALITITVLLTSNESESARRLAIDARPDTITTLICESEVMIFETLTEQFALLYPEHEIRLITAADGDYADTLESLRASGDPPALFFTEGYDLPEFSAPLHALFSVLNESDYLFLPNYGGITLTFSAPVCYINTTLASTPDDMNALTDALREQGYDELADPETFFYTERIPFFVSTTDRLRDVQEHLPGYYQVMDMSTGVVYPGDVWHISAAASENQQQVGQLFLGFLLGEYAQNLLCIQYNLGIPINRTIFTQYIDIHNDLNFLRTGIQNVEMFEITIE